jgi:hypothetical protein
LTWWQTLRHKSTRGQRRRKGEASHGPYWHRRAQEGSQIYILAQGGEVIEQRIRTEAARFAAVLGTRPRARILIEASTDSEWVARAAQGVPVENVICASGGLR